MQIILFDTAERINLYPFTEVNPVAELRTGIFTIRERWQLQLQKPASILTDDYLSKKNPQAAGNDLLYIDARLFADAELMKQIQQLSSEEVLVFENTVLAVRTAALLPYGFTMSDCRHCRVIEWPQAVTLLNYPFELSQWNAETIKSDFELIQRNNVSRSIPSSNHLIAPENIFMEEGAVAEHCFLNASTGPIYIGKNSLIMEGSMIRGPFALLENGVVKMGSKIYGATTVGKNCTVGGEIKTTVFFDYSNKAHDGYLGDAVIGSWCNIGAGTSCSNIKNTASDVKIWNQRLKQWIHAGTKCGVLMGDYTRTAINTSLNTGTVTGICCNLFNHGFLSKYIPDFTWNTVTGEKYVAEKALKDINNWMMLKQQEITDADQQILLKLYSKQS